MRHRTERLRRKYGWTSAAPTTPGFYWLRVVGEFEPEVVRVSASRGTLHVELCGSNRSAAVQGERHEWAGPLVAPP